MRPSIRARSLAGALVAGLLLSLPVTSPAAAAPTRYEAENATISQGTVDTRHAGFTGTGFVDYANVAGSHVEFTVNAATAGNYRLAFRFANGTTTDRPMDISVNGTTVSAGLSFPGTGAWTTWVEKSVTAGLIAGANKVRATATTANGGPNLDRLSASAPADTQPPTAPAGLRVVGEIRPTSVGLAWNASTDDVGVSQYRIYNGGNVLVTVGGNITSLTVPGLTPNTRYVFSVLAYDAAGNPSQGSNSVDLTTPPGGDTTPPSTPAGLHATGVTANTVTLGWNASTDDVGVTGYNVYRDGTRIATVPDLTATVDGLTPDTAYSFEVEAFDADDNVSPRTAPLPVRTTGTRAAATPSTTGTSPSSTWRGASRSCRTTARWSPSATGSKSYGSPRTGRRRWSARSPRRRPPAARAASSAWPPPRTSPPTATSMPSTRPRPTTGSSGSSTRTGGSALASRSSPA